MDNRFICEQCGDRFVSSPLQRSDSIFLCERCCKGMGALKASVMLVLRDGRINLNAISKAAGLNQTLRRDSVRASAQTLAAVREQLLDLARYIEENLR